MKRFVVVGLGNFGASVARALYERRHEVIALDLDQDKVDRIAPHVSRAAFGDGRETEVLEHAGAGAADVGIVSTGDDITASVLSTLALRDVGVKEVYVKVISFDHARVMRRMGAAEVIFPEHESALNLAARLSESESLLKYVDLGGGFGLQEMVVPNAWEGKTLRELDLRVQYGVTVVGVHDVLTGTMNVPPDPDAVLKDSDTLVIAGKEEALKRTARLK
ncbi:TrkA family potassium uptake protein [Rhodocaloribacter litoris]|uniref:potassium channel family protein n=1 Tax=Rhodocaloribacter litoris TaxID=2558931 RepID=UPI00142214CD|nr:TrkA family potassium uptake protein [Rhodocaloribacter litoris]QXD16842.1 TrkA family potassium uptake protein [Rhodocaloribacter litoris]GIV60501.1 MAG: hypothetical protein KatS3mg043_1590 [Rhodothermaceae bacterium]